MRNLPVLFLTLTILIISGCKDNRIVAKIGNHPIYTDAYKEYFIENYTFGKSPRISEKSKSDMLNLMIDEEIQYVDALKNHIDQDPKLKIRKERIRDKLIIDTVINKEVVDKVISEKDILERYNTMSTEVKIRQIFIPIPSSNNKKEIAQVELLLDSLRTVIVKGGNFGEIARKFSTDSLSAGKGGEMGFISFDEKKYEPTFLKMVFNLEKGSITPVFQTAKGFHIVQMQEKRRLLNFPYEYEKNKIQQSFFKEKSVDLKNQYEKFSDEIKKGYKVQVIDENFQYLMNTINVVTDSLQKAGEAFDINKIQGRIDSSRVLISYHGGRSSDIHDFITEINTSTPVFMPSMWREDIMRDNLEKFALHQSILYYGYAHGFDHNKQVVTRLNKKMKEIITSEAYKLLVLKKVDPEACKLYFNENKEVFLNPAKFKIQLIQVDDEKLADMIYSKATQKNNFQDLAAKYNMDNNLLKNKGDIGYITSKQRGQIGITAANLKAGEISQPFKEDDKYSIIKVVDIIPGETSDFDSLDNKVKGTVKKTLIEKVKNDWVENMKKSYPVVIFENNLAKVFSENKDDIL